MNVSNMLQKLLVIDENPAFCKKVIAELRKDYPSFEAKCADNRQLTESCLDFLDFDLVIVNYELSWSNGFEYLYHIKKRTSRIPVVMRFQDNMEDLVIEACKLELDGYVVSSGDHLLFLRPVVRTVLMRQQESDKAQARDACSELLMKRNKIGWFEITPEGRLLGWNSLLVEVLQLEKVSETEIQRAFSEEFLGNRGMKMISSMQSENKIQKREFDYLSPHGSQEKNILLTVFPCSVAASSRSTIFGTIEDITESKNQDEKYNMSFKRLNLLSTREKEIMRLATSGKTNKQTASELDISIKTVEMHRHSLMKKLHLESFADLVKISVLTEKKPS